MTNQVTIIGAGNLTTSLLTAIHRKKFPYKINVIDIDKKKRVFLKNFNVNFFTSYTDILTESDLIILMVKPNNYNQVIEEMNPYLSKKAIIVSFMAGIKSSLIKSKLSHNVPVVRCMTNITISDSESHVFYHMKPFSSKIVKRLDKFFGSFSKLKKCSNEEDINKVTALYGSGPAYYVYFNQIMKDVFINMGINTLIQSSPQKALRTISGKFNNIYGCKVKAIPEMFTTWDKIKICAKKIGIISIKDLIMYLLD